MKLINRAYDMVAERVDWIKRSVISVPPSTDSSFPFQEIGDRFQLWLRRQYDFNLAVIASSHTWAWNCGCHETVAEPWATPCEVTHVFLDPWILLPSDPHHADFLKFRDYSQAQGLDIKMMSYKYLFMN